MCSHFYSKALKNLKKNNKSAADSLSLAKAGLYTIVKRVFIIEQYFKSSESLTAAVRKFHTKYARNNILTLKRWSETHDLLKLPDTRSNNSIKAVRVSVVDNKGTFCRGQELTNSKESL